MHIHLKNVIPKPIAGLYDPQTFIWGKELSLDTSKRYKVFAPSGKGKSTFVSLIYGIRDDYEGQVCYDSRSIDTFSDEEMSLIRQQKISVIFQDLKLFPHLTARENILANRYLTDEASGDYEVLAQKFGIASLLDKEAALLSYGEKQRVAIIRALVQPFDFLLMDEPFSHLDENNIKIACEEIEKVCLENDAGLLICSLGYDYFLKYDEELRL